MNKKKQYNSSTVRIKLNNDTLALVVDRAKEEDISVTHLINRMLSMTLGCQDYKHEELHTDT